MKKLKNHETNTFFHLNETFFLKSNNILKKGLKNIKKL